MASLELEGVSRRFGRALAVDGIDLIVPHGGFTALLGPSGCGKTTLLRLIAGFEQPDAGKVRFDGTTVSRPGWSLPPEERGVGMVFQSYALWPHMTVAGNVEFALKVRRLPRPEREKRVRHALEGVGLADKATARPSMLSGGQRQRVALARCLAMQPRIVLLDEPLANLDAHLRETMQVEFRRLHREAQTTFVYVTHDQAEALALSSTVVVMDRGRVAQIADPRGLYREPATAMVARFVGGGIVVAGRAIAAATGGTQVDVLGARILARGLATAGEPVELCIRPPDLRIGVPEGIDATVSDVRFQGARSMVTAKAGDGVTLRIEHDGPLPIIGETVRIGVGDAWILPGNGR